VRKTSVYLSDDEADGLRRAAEATGRSQSELIRAGIQMVLQASGVGKRQFHSMGKGHGGGAPYAPWDSDEVYKAVTG
jgi:Arc/MetJ-type ribon-helix-helix transcriptional regulator